MGPETQVVEVFRSTEPTWRGWGHWEATEEDLVRAEKSLILFGGLMLERFILEDLLW